MQEIIESKDNPKIKQVKKLLLKKYRSQLGLFLVENQKIVEDALGAGHDFKELFLTEEFMNSNPGFANRVRQRSIASIHTVSNNLAKHISGLSTPPGICAVYKINENSISENKPSVYLNAINDPGNLGSIIRNMIAFGYHNLILDEQCADIYNTKTILAAKDGIFKISIHRDQNTRWLMSTTCPIYASHVEKGEDITDFKKDPNFCLVLGSESHGVSKEILSISSRRLYIPTSDEMESLNVASASAILLYKLK